MKKHTYKKYNEFIFAKIHEKYVLFILSLPAICGYAYFPYIRFYFAFILHIKPLLAYKMIYYLTLQHSW